MSQKTVVQDIFALLSGAGLQATAIYDAAPENAVSPYVVLGQLQSLEGRLLSGQERRWALDIHIWSSYEGRKEVVEIADEIIAALPNNLFAEELVVIRDPSDWYHGILTVRGYDR